MSGLVRFHPDQLYLVYHPSGPDYCAQLGKYVFVDGRIPGFVNGDVAAHCEAFGAQCIDYADGLDIARWEDQEGDVHRCEPIFAINGEPFPDPEEVRAALLEAVDSDPAGSNRVLSDFADFATDAPAPVKNIFDRVYDEVVREIKPRVAAAQAAREAAQEDEAKQKAQARREAEAERLAQLEPPPGSEADPGQVAGAASVVEATDPGGDSLPEPEAKTLPPMPAPPKRGKTKKRK